MVRFVRVITLFLLLFCLTETPAGAQSPSASAAASASASSGRAEKELVQLAKNIARECLKEETGWMSASCLKVNAYSNRILAANYIAALKEKGKTKAAGSVEQQCAAATALGEVKATQETVGNVLAECANQISDMTAETGIKPDLSHYQLLIAATLCITKDARCEASEQALAATLASDR